jgi:hypothetical protein
MGVMNRPFRAESGLRLHPDATLAKALRLEYGRRSRRVRPARAAHERSGFVLVETPVRAIATRFALTSGF